MMFRHDNPGVGDLVRSLSRKIEDMQREIAALRQDIRTLTFLVRQQQGETSSTPAEPAETPV